MAWLAGIVPLTKGPHDASKTETTVPVQIDCSNNKLRELPCGLAAASGLLSVKADHNALSSLQPEMASAWGRLTSLDMSHNCLAALPDTVSCLQRYSSRESSSASRWHPLESRQASMYLLVAERVCCNEAAQGLAVPSLCYSCRSDYNSHEGRHPTPERVESIYACTRPWVVMPKEAIFTWTACHAG